MSDNAATDRQSGGGTMSTATSGRMSGNRRSKSSINLAFSSAFGTVPEMLTELGAEV